MRVHSHITVCVAIPTYNRERVLVDTLEQVLVQDSPADEVLVIDQTEEHELETRSYLDNADKAGRIRWIKYSPPNLPAARNRALAETRCHVIIFIDDDVVLPPLYVENHRKNYADSRVVAVAGRIIQAFRYQARSNQPQIMDYRFFPLDSTERKEGVASFGGGNHSARVSALKGIGGYDENYIGWAYREDSDAAIRLWKAGGMIVFDPDAWLKHLAIPTGGCRLKVNNKRLPEWKASFPATYFAVRHLFPNCWFWHDVMVGNMRRYILRRDNVCNPWRLPWAFLSYVYSFLLAVWLCVHGHKTKALLHDRKNITPVNN